MYLILCAIVGQLINCDLVVLSLMVFLLELMTNQIINKTGLSTLRVTNYSHFEFHFPVTYHPETVYINTLTSIVLRYTI